MMIDRVIELCFARRKLFFVVTALVILFGAYAWRQLSITAYPHLAGVNVQVTTQVPGLAAQEIEQEITTPLERALATVPGLTHMRSSSTFGLSLITLVFDGRKDQYWERERVSFALSQATLPPGITPGLNPVSGPAGEIYRYTLESDHKNLMQLSEIQRWMVIPALQTVRGVANVDNFGGFTEEFQLELDPAKLLRYHVSVTQVTQAIQNNTSNAIGGRIVRGEQAYVVRGVGMVHSLAALGEIMVRESHGVPVLVRDLGTLRYGHKIRQGILGINGNPDAIEGIVDLLDGANASAVLKAVHTKVAELNGQLAAEGVRVAPYYDRDYLVQSTIDNVFRIVLEGVILVGIVLFLFLGDLRPALVVAITIPMSLVTVFILIYLTHMPMNLFSIGSIDFGVIVDGAVVVTEAILLRREAGPGDVLTDGDVLDAAKQVGRPIFFAILIIITAYLPLFAFEHAAGRLSRPIAFTVSYALLAALLCTVTLIPGLAYVALRAPRKTFHNRSLEYLRAGFKSSLRRSLGRPCWSVGVTGIAFVAVGALGSTLGSSFMPTLDEGALWLQVQMPAGLSLDEASRLANRLRRVARTFPEVTYAVTQDGRSDDGTDPWTPSHIEADIILKPFSEWPAGLDMPRFRHEFKARLERELPAMTIRVSQPIADGVNDLISGAHSKLVLYVFGDSFKTLRRISGQVIETLKSIPGTQASIFEEPPIPQLVITANRAAAARYGINISDITSVIQTAIGGAPITQIYVGNRIYDVTARVSDDVANDVQALGRLPVTSASGAQIPLAMVAHIAFRTGEGTISHVGGKRELSITVNNNRMALSKFVSRAQRLIAQKVHFDPQHERLQWAGSFQQAQHAEHRLVVIVAMMLAIMLALLYAEYGKLRQALLLLVVVPLATLGGLIALHLRGYTFNIATAVGFIALFGVAVQNGVIMISNINRWRRDGHALADAVVEGAAERFRPVLMTASVATLGMLPAALAAGIGTDVQRELATVVVGGLVLATLLTLYLLPSLYYLLESHVERRRGPSRRRTVAGIAPP
ncbi:MAG TPA: CusA/CzcA family heavy metal efflux RND transporter [Nevskiaceae bacterium]|nr:CusA/CzcA family heavy metal efflux RND transporter [Nevskiaceae bacterium]